MLISAVITSYFVLGLKVLEDKLSFESFYFELPFPYFRDSDENYWIGVRQKILEMSGADSTTKVYAACQDEYLLKTNIFDGLSRISDILGSSTFPLIYLGETKGSVKGIVSPFVINPSDFYKWFYLAENINQVENYFYNRQAYGAKKPSGNWEEGFEESLFREKISYIFENSKSAFFNTTSDLILTGEGTLFAGDIKRITLSFLDGCKVEGFWRIYLDKASYILNIHNIGYYNTELSKKLFEKLNVEDLAGCLVVPGALELEIKSSDNQNLKVKLKENSISVIPFDKENLVDIKVKYEKKTKFIKVSGGDLGLVIDNRLRPLLSDKNAKQRIALIDKWISEISSKFEFDEKMEKAGNESPNTEVDDKNTQKEVIKKEPLPISVGKSLMKIPVQKEKPQLDDIKLQDNPLPKGQTKNDLTKLREEKKL